MRHLTKSPAGSVINKPKQETIIAARTTIYKIWLLTRWSGHSCMNSTMKLTDEHIQWNVEIPNPHRKKSEPRYSGVHSVMTEDYAWCSSARWVEASSSRAENSEISVSQVEEQKIYNVGLECIFTELSPGSEVSTAVAWEALLDVDCVDYIDYLGMLKAEECPHYLVVTSSDSIELVSKAWGRIWPDLNDIQFS